MQSVICCQDTFLRKNRNCKTGRFIMAAYVARNDKTALPSSHESGQFSKTQRITHSDILALGHTIFQKNDENQREVFNKEITKLRDELLRKAEEEKDLALKELEQNAVENLAKANDEARAQQELMVKEESKRVKEMMKKVANVQVEQERKDGEKRMKKMLRKQKEQFEHEKSTAIKETREEEEDKATEMVTKLMKQHEENIARVKKEADQTKKNELAALEVKMRTEKENALLQLRDLLQKEAQTAREEMKCLHQEDLQIKNRELQIKEDQLMDLYKEIEEERELHNQTKEKLKFVLTSYQNFIDTQPGFSKGQADFLLKDFLLSQ